MSTILESLAATSARPQHVLQRGVRHLVRGILAMGKAIANRRRVTEMLELDDRMLKDIGLDRCDVRGALAGPLAHDPSIVLRLRSVDHRARQRALQVAAGRVRAVESCL
ncbi:DUF1127 domain-containing protein [uncultured Enterovirga sp.]|uniref:DUF1127 domain-containing protein n=1 Tax=uncultured Enterovirga sp. TaxID=2026352 RepID=UPI0035CAC158